MFERSNLLFAVLLLFVCVGCAFGADPPMCDQVAKDAKEWAEAYKKTEHPCTKFNISLRLIDGLEKIYDSCPEYRKAVGIDSLLKSISNWKDISVIVKQQCEKK
jgi:hypothetical protein